MNSRETQPIQEFTSHGWTYGNITLKLDEANDVQWWEVVEECNDSFYKDVLAKLPYADCKEDSVFYTFNDKLFPSSLSPYIGGG